MILKILFLLSFIYKYYCLNKFTIHSQGKNVITTKILDQNEYSSIVITQKGGFIKYKSDSSIMSFKKNENLITESDPMYFMCQFSANEIILIRGNEMKLINLNDYENVEINRFDDSRRIISLQCNYNLKNYIITYLSENRELLKFDIYSSHFNIKHSYSTQINDPTFISSSCLLLDITHILCINALESTMKYNYLGVSGTNVVKLEDQIINLVDFNRDYQIKGVILKYYSNSEILMCINANAINPKEDINLICYMINIIPSGNNLNFEVKASFIANEEVTDKINFCQIEKLTSSNSNIYVSICLSFYYRTKYLLSIFKYSNNEFSLYNTDYKDIQFSLLERTPI